MIPDADPRAPWQLPGTQLQLHPASDADRESCWQVHRAAMRNHVQATWGWDEVDQAARFAAGFQPRLTWTLRLDGQTVGMLVLDEASDPVRLLSLALLPTWQRRGMGGALLQAVLARNAGRPVWLQVLMVNPALGLYRRTGFEVIAENATHRQMLHPGLAAEAVPAG